VLRNNRAETKAMSTDVYARNGKAMSQPPAHNMWRPDSEFWSVNRAKHLFADGYELVAFDLPAANG